MELKLVVLAVVILAATVAEARYFRVPGRMNFRQAQIACRRRRARLATIYNSAQNRAVLRALRGVRRGQPYWIGLNDIRREGRWVWNNGRPLRYRFFARGEPNNAGNQDCAVTNYNRFGQWDDRRCTDRVFGAICQTRRRPRPKPKVGYFRVPGRMNYRQAQMACRRRRARLAIILNSRQNAASLRALRGTRAGQTYWIGLDDIKREGRWVWNNGQRLRFRYFARGEPNNGGGKQDCAVANYSRQRRWDDQSCGTRAYGALCQRYVAKKCPKTRIIKGRCARNGLRAVKHIYYAIRGGRCRRKVYIKRVRCRGGHGKFCRCSAVGDPHYRTFDGIMIHFYGICKYTLAKSVGGGACAFDVQVKNERRGRNRRVSYTRFVEVKMGRRTYRLDQRRRVYVDNTIQAPPIKAGKIRVFYSGRVVQFVHSTCGVRVAFDGRSNAYLQVSGRYRGKMTGICGSCNGNRADDMTTKDGKRVRGKSGYNKIGDSYAVKDDSPGRHRCKSKVVTPPQPKKWCKGRMARLIKTKRFCGGLRDPRGPFGKCIRVARINPNELYNSCKIDVCANTKNRGQQHKSKCQAFKALEERCNEKGITGINWRNRYGCPLHCGRNKVYSTSLNPCPKTCENHFLGTKSRCFKLPRREGCQCKPGFLRDGALCVKPANCKCLELCIDRKPKACRRWAKKGRCRRFPRFMRLNCALTCKFCKKPVSPCEDRISTRRCMKFRKQGKCKFAFYRNICGLSCNLKGCPCKKGKKKVGPCLVRRGKIQRVTIITFIRSKRTHRCVKRKRSFIRPCNKCRKIRRVKVGRCNVCKRFRIVTKIRQGRIRKRCVRRVTRRRVRCNGCRGGRMYRRCVRHRIRLIVFTRRVPSKRCNRCVIRKRTKRTVVKCPRPRKTVSPCSRVTRRKLITLRYYVTRNCGCRLRIKRRYVLCRCRKATVRRYCNRRARVTVITKFVKRGRRCVPIRRRFAKPVRCPSIRRIRGRCRPHPVCHRVDVQVRYYVDRRCRCRRVVKRKAVRCCCNPKRVTKRCVRRLGLIQITTTTYRLVYSRRLRRPICIRRRRIRRKRMRCGRKRVFVGVTRCRRPRCIRTYTYLYSHRRGCKCYRRKVIRRRRCCCRPSRGRKRCVRNNRIVRIVTSYRLIRGRCRRFVRRYNIRRVTCRRNRVIRRRCNRATRKRLITYIYYRVRGCRCYRRVRNVYKLCSCGPRVVRYGRCNKRTCKQTKLVLIRVGPIRGRCITEKRVRKLRCCCGRSSVRRVCNRRIGFVQIIKKRNIFVRRTRRCVRRVSVRTIYKRCPRPTRRVYPCRGYTRKIVYTRSYRIRRLCRCRNVSRVVVLRCRCPPNKRLPTICVRGRKVTRVLVYRLRRNRCIRRIKRYYKTVFCGRGRRIRNGKCNRACRRVVTVSYVVRNNRTCRCVRRTRRYVRLCCCKSSKNKRCVRGNRVVTTVVRRRLNRRRTRCIPRVSRRVKMISCRRRHVVRRGGCNRRTCRRRFYYTRFAVRRCKCVVVRRYVRKRVCCCRPARRVTRRCVRNIIVTTITRRFLYRGRCITRRRKYAKGTPCPRPVRRKSRCKRGRYYISIIYYRRVNCKCRRVVRKVVRFCRCRRATYYKGRCTRRRVRLIFRSVYVLVRGGRRCRKVTRVIGREPCRCPGSRRTVRCVGLGKRVITVRFYTKFVRVRGSRLRRRICLRRVSSKFYRTRCRRSVLRVSPCRNYRKIFRRYYSYVRRCRCYRRSRIIRIKACNCRRKNRVYRRCYRNIYRQIIIKTYRPRGRVCALKRTVRNRRVPCLRKVSTRKIRGCNLRVGYSFYNVFLRTRWTTVRCRCRPFRRTFRVLCRCARPKYIKRCIGNARVFIKVYYIKSRNRCLRRVRRSTTRILCRPRVRTRRGGCNRRTCYRRVKATYRTRRGCKCFKRVRYVRQRCCCRKSTVKPGTRPGGWKYRGCSRGYKVYSNTRYVLRPTRYFRVRIGGRYYVRIVKCRRIVKTIKKRTVCRMNRKVIKRCNKRTGVLYISIYYTVRRGCRCIRRRIRRRRRCGCNPRSVVRKGPCKRGRYYRTVTVKKQKLVRGRCIWYRRKYRIRCRCRKPSKSKRCDRRGNIVTTIITSRLVGRYCRRKIYRRSKPMKCGRASTKERVLVGKCRRGKIRVLYVRVVVNKRTCRCVRKVRVRYFPCRCPLTKVRRLGCLRNTTKIILIIRYRRIGFRCIRQRIRLFKRIKCRTGIYKRLLKCNPKRNRRILLIFIYGISKCRCTRRVVRKSIVCACKPVIRYTKVCVSNNTYKIQYQRGYKKGYTCKYRTVTRIKRVRCNRRPRTRALRCNRKTCRRTYIVSVVVPRKCKCRRIPVRRYRRICCCKPNVRRSRKCIRGSIVITVSYTVRRGYRCIRRRRVRSIPTRCSRRRWSRRACKGCNGVRRYYRYKNIRCKCRPAVYYVKRVKCCCKPPVRIVKRCLARRGVFVTTVYRSYLRRGRCLKRAKSTIRRIRCVTRISVIVSRKCRRNKRLVKIVKRFRRGCKCYTRVVRRFTEPCKCPRKLFVKKTRCKRYFKYVSVYRKVYRRRRRRGYCATILVKRYRERCRCYKVPKKTYCARHYIRVTIKTRVILTKRRPKRCIKKRTVKRKPMGGCRLRPKVVNKRYGVCNKKTMMRRITKIFVVARNCRCRKFSRTYRKRCACPKRRRRTVCYRNNWLTIFTYYISLRRGDGIVCIRKIRRSVRRVGCKRGVIKKFGRCFRRGRRLSRRYITYYKYYKRACRCYRRVFRRIVAPCRCGPIRKQVRCTRFWKIVRVIISRLNRKRTACIRRTIVERRKIKCKRGVTKRNTKCRRNSYFRVVIRRYVNRCRCRKRVFRRRCDCKCRKTRVIRRCSKRYLIYVFTTRYVKRNCRCRGFRSVRRIYPRCPKRRRTYRSKCNIKRGRTTYYLIRYYRRLINRRRCLCRVRVYKRYIACKCNPKVRKVTRCIRNRLIYTTLSRMIINRRLNRCVRRIIRRIRRYVRCKAIRTVYKCNKRKGVLYMIYYRAYTRNCKCRRVRRVRKLGRCRCDRRWRTVSNKCVKRTCRRYIRLATQRLVGRRCIKYTKLRVLKCCCPRRRSRKWCSARRGLWITQITRFVLKNKRRCVARTTTKRRAVRCSGRVTRRKICRYRRYLTIYVYKVLRSGCACRRRLVRVIRNLRCGCGKPSVKKYCLYRRRRKVTIRISYVLRRYRCIRITKRSSKGVRCPRGVRRTKGKCNRRSCKIYHYFTRFYVTRRCKCIKRVVRRRYSCCCKPAVRKSRRCYGRTGLIVTTFLYRRLSRRTRRCRTIIERRRRKVSCRPSVWVANKKLNRCIPAGRFGIRYTIYRRRVRRGCRCITQKYRKACHCRCRGPRRRSVCRYNRLRYIYYYSYKFNGCKCRRRARVRAIRIRCRRNKRIIGRCYKCRQRITRIYYRIRNCRCYRSIRRSRRVCCCGPNRVTRRCIAGRIKSKRVIINRFVPYRCIRIVRNYRVLVRCPRSKRIRHTRCSRGKYVVTRVDYRRRNCKCIKVTRRVTLRCPCRRGRKIIGGCNRRTCKRVNRLIYYILVKFRCIRRVRRSVRRCCCRRRPVRRIVCRRNRRIREYYWTVLRGQSCVRKVRRRDVTPRCGPRKSVRRVCRRGRLTIYILTSRWIRCRCYRKRRRIVGRCTCPRSRRRRQCIRNRVVRTTYVYYVLVGIRCIRRIRRRNRVKVCGKPRVRRYGCNRRSCVKTSVFFFTKVRGCRCYKYKSVSRVACCCKPYLRTRIRRYCDVRRGAKVTVIVKYRFNNRKKRCVRFTKVYRRRIRCSRRVYRRVGRCVIRRGNRKYQIVLLIRRRRLACKCLKLKIRKVRLCKCGRSKTSKRCVGGAIVVTKTKARLVVSRGRRYCRVTRRVINRIMKRCRRPYYKRGRCYRGRLVYYKIIHQKIGCKCRRRVYKRYRPCKCRRSRARIICNRRRNILTRITIRYFRICPRGRYGWLRCRCIRKIRRRVTRVRCRKPLVYVSKCKRGKQVKRVLLFKLANCRCYKRTIVRRRRCKSCYNILTKRACKRANRRRKVCVKSPLYRKHLCKNYCKSCKPCAKGPKRVKYYKKPRRGLKTDKRYKKRYVIKKIRTPYTRKGIKVCKKKCAQNKLCKSFEVIKPKKTKPTKPVKPTKPGQKKPKKMCTCVLQTVTPRTLRKYERRNYKGSKAPKRILYIRHCRKACKKKKVYRRVGRCRCNRALKVCYALVRVIWERANRRGKCVKRSKLVKASCKLPCVNLRPKKTCKRLTRRGGCRRLSVRRVCNKSCMPRCRCRKSYKIFSPCKRVGRRLITYLTYVKVRRVLKICTIKIYRRSKLCKRCSRTTRTRTYISRCVRNKRTITTYTYYRAVRKGRQVCLRKRRRVRLNCRGCCPSVVTRISPCRRGRRVRVRIYWARIRNCCRRKVVRETYRCNRCPRDIRRNGPCRYGVRVEFRFWYARSATTGRCYRRKTIRVRSCSRR